MNLNQPKIRTGYDPNVSKTKLKSQINTCLNGSNIIRSSEKKTKISTKNRVLNNLEGSGRWKKMNQLKIVKNAEAFCKSQWKRLEFAERERERRSTLNAYQLPRKRPAICRTVTPFVTGETGYCLLKWEGRLGSAFESSEIVVVFVVWWELKGLVRGPDISAPWSCGLLC